MNKFKKILAFLNYGSQAFSALSKGLEVIIDNWPSFNPFASDVPTTPKE